MKTSKSRAEVGQSGTTRAALGSGVDSGKLTGTAWFPGAELGLADWIDHGRRLGAIGRASAWWIGDWLRYGNLEFGERYARASRITGYDAQTLMNMVYVATAIPPEQRREALSWSHHAEVAALAPEQREHWLRTVEADRLSVRCLRAEIRRHRPRTPAVRAARSSADETPLADRQAQRCCPRCGQELVVADG